MTIETVTNSDIQYYLVSYDKDGNERTDDPDAPGGRLSSVVKDELAGQPITDVFFMSHGWKGDVPAAKEQYDNWIGAMLECQADRERVRQVRPGFRPLLVGLHWPSLPWGDESLEAAAASFAPGQSPIEAWVDDAADKLADSDRAKAALRTIFTAALDDISPPTLPAEVVDAYRVLQEEASLVAEGSAAAPGADAESFNPEQRYQEELSDVASFGGVPGVGGLLSVLRQLSFWKMKDRARTFGGKRCRDPAAGASGDRGREGCPFPPHGPQLRLHSCLGDGSRRWGGYRADQAGPLDVLGAGSAVVVGLLFRHPGGEKQVRLFQLDCERPKGDRPYRHHSVRARHRSGAPLSAGGRPEAAGSLCPWRASEIRRPGQLRSARTGGFD